MAQATQPNDLLDLTSPPPQSAATGLGGQHSHGDSNDDYTGEYDDSTKPLLSASPSPAPSNLHSTAEDDPWEKATADDVMPDEYNDFVKSEDPENRRTGMKAWLFFLPTDSVPIWATLVLTIMAFVPAVIYLYFFTPMGEGITYFYYLAKYYEDDTPIWVGVYCVFAIVLYILDFSYWGQHGSAGKVGQLCFGFLFFFGFISVVLLKAQDYSYGPVCLVPLVMPLWMALIKTICFRRLEFRTYACWLSLPFFLVFVTVGVGWIMWILYKYENHWTDLAQAEYAEAVGCEPDFKKYPSCIEPVLGKRPCFIIEGPIIKFPGTCKKKCQDVYDACLNTFILWVGPFLVCVIYFFMSFFVTFLRATDLNQQMNNFMKLWGFLIAVMWISGMVCGAGDGLNSALTAFIVTAFIGSFIFLGASFSQETQRGAMTSFTDSLMEKFGWALDIVKGLLVLLCSPLLGLYIVMSFLNQMMRKTNCPLCMPLEDEGDRRSLLTKACRLQLEEVTSWEHTKVFTYANYIGILIFSVQVLVGQFTILFLSWIIEATSTINIWAVTGIMYGIGIFLFLLPPISGIPIYMTFGIVVVSVGTPVFGLVGALIYCNVACLLMKLTACALEQKAIGETLSDNISVRKTVAVNSNLIRTMKLILSEPGLSMPKIAILIGAPDWPTSVLCGIMKLNLFQILLGTLPVVINIAPCVLFGSFTYMSDIKDESGEKLLYPQAKTWASLMAAFMSFVALALTGLVVKFIEIAGIERAEELKAMPYDEEVRELEVLDARKARAYDHVSRWQVLPSWAKGVMLTALFFNIMSIYMVLLAQEKCFMPYGLTKTITKDLDGHWQNLIKGPGRVAIVFFLVSAALLSLFTQWATMMANGVDIDTLPVEPENEEPERTTSPNEQVESLIQKSNRGQ